MKNLEKILIRILKERKTILKISHLIANRFQRYVLKSLVISWFKIQQGLSTKVFDKNQLHLITRFAKKIAKFNKFHFFFECIIKSKTTLSC